MTRTSDASRITVYLVSGSPRILTWLLLVLLVGGHWGMLQMVAWTGMLIEYSRDNSVAEAVEMTFGGAHPCALCKQIDRGVTDDLGKVDGKTPGKLVKTVKLDAVVTSVALALPPPPIAALTVTDQDDVATGIMWEPLRRPPRVQT